MNARLESLLRQRDLIRGHLAWLDREIAETQGMPPPASQGDLPPVTLAQPVTQAPIAARGAVPVPIAEEVDVKGIHNDVRRGCLLYAAIAVALLGALIGFIYWHY